MLSCCLGILTMFLCAAMLLWHPDHCPATKKAAVSFVVVVAFKYFSGTAAVTK